MRRIRWLGVGVLACFAALGSCSEDQRSELPVGTGGTGAVGGGATGGSGGQIDPGTDADGDTITDVQEGAPGADTNGDATPDYLDDDSDGDGLPDALEAGDADPGTLPVDSDLDGTPNFRDPDSDDDGLADGDEDLDHDGQLDPGESDPTSADTDGDGVSDLIEDVAGTDPQDPADNPAAQGNFVFLVPYQGPPTPPEDVLRFRTNIRKVDLYFLEDISVSMDQELLAIHDNLVTMLDALTCDPGETPASCAADCPAGCGDDSCTQGETVTNCPQDCFGTCGDGACVGNENGATCPVDCAASCGDRVCAAGETATSCPSDCTGSCGDGICHAGEQAAVTACIEDIQSGAGVYGTSSSAAACGGSASCAAGQNGSFAYRNLLDIQPSALATQGVLPTDCWGQPCWEPGLAATFYAVTGWGTATATAAGYTLPPLAVADPPGCAAGYRGYPCFRPDSLPILLLIGDEPFRQCYLPAGTGHGSCANGPSTAMTPRDFHEVSDAVNAMGAKIIGVQGAGGGAELTADFTALATETGSFGAGNQPLVYQGADATAGTAIAQGVRDLAAGLPLDMHAMAEDDPADAVDTIAAFVDYLDTFTPGTAECIDWPSRFDNEPDGHDDEFLGVTPGLPVCWKIHVKGNTTVPPTGSVQVFEARLKLKGNDVIDLDTRTVFFVVPPDVAIPN
ncbi:MAG: hypothetical protein IT373_16895 [Polyangiaceae bacterium]|nr:hypothetical protein [Polyangiaceae bacterium]